MEADDEVYWLYLQHNTCMRAAMNLRAMDRRGRRWINAPLSRCK